MSKTSEKQQKCPKTGKIRTKRSENRKHTDKNVGKTRKYRQKSRKPVKISTISSKNREQIRKTNKNVKKPINMYRNCQKTAKNV